MMNRLIKALAFFFVLSTLAYSQVVDLEGPSLPYLNQQLREQRRRMDQNDTDIAGYTINTWSGILALDSGGTGVSLADPGGDYFLWWDDSDGEVEIDTLEVSTDDTLGGDSDTAIPTEQAVKAYVDALTPGTEWISTDTWNNALLTPDIEITQGSRYMVILDYVPNGNEDAQALLKFGDVTAYDDAANYANEGDAIGDASFIIMAPAIYASSSTGMCHAVFYLNPIFTDQMMVTGQSTYYTSGGPVLDRFEIVGHWDSSETVTRFKIIFTGGGDDETKGKIVLLKINES